MSTDPRTGGVGYVDCAIRAGYNINGVYLQFQWPGIAETTSPALPLEVAAALMEQIQQAIANVRALAAAPVILHSVAGSA